MNLLEQAMRHKAMRDSKIPRQVNPALSEAKTLALPQSAAHPVSHKRLIVGGIGIVLTAILTGILLVSFKDMPSAALPTQAMATTEQSVLTAATQDGANDGREKVLTFVDDWVKAWSEKAVDKYLSAYAPEFKPANGLSRSAWEKQRWHRLTQYKRIEVKLTNLTAFVENDTATVEFTQSFKADSFSETGVHKRLVLKLQGSRWMIAQEVIR